MIRWSGERDGGIWPSRARRVKARDEVSIVPMIV